MAKFAVDIDDFAEGNLPGLCLVCGKKASNKFERVFTRKPTWMIIYNYLPFSTFYTALDKTKGKVPLCKSHKKRLTLGRRLVLIFLLVVAIMFAAAVACFVVVGGIKGASFGAACILLFLPILCLFPPSILYVDLATPRVVEIDSASVTLDSVSEKFLNRLVMETPKGLPTSPKTISVSNSLPKIVFGIAVGVVFLPITIGLGTFAYGHYQQRKTQLAQQNAPKQKQPLSAEQTTKANTAPEPTKQADELDLSPSETVVPADETANVESKSNEADTTAENNTPPEVDSVMGNLLGGAAPKAATTNLGEPSTVAEAIQLISRSADHDRTLELINWIDEQNVDQSDHEKLITALSPKRYVKTNRTAAMRVICKYATKEDHADLIRNSCEIREGLDDVADFLKEPFAKMREWEDEKAFPLLVNLIGTPAGSLALDELVAWGEPAVPTVLSLINERSPKTQEAASILINRMKISGQAILQQCLADLDDPKVDKKRIAERVTGIIPEPKTQVALGKCIARLIPESGVNIDELVEAFKACVCHEHVQDINNLLSKEQGGKVLDAGRSMAIHLRDPDTYAAVVALIDVPFGQNRTAEVCRELGPAVQKELWAYLSIPRRVNLVCEILNDIGTSESIRPLSQLASRTTDKRLSEKIGEIIVNIKKTGNQRAKEYRAQEKERLAEAERVAKALGFAPAQKVPTPTTAEPETKKKVVRVWTDQSGRFKRKGELLNKTDTTIQLRIDGKIVDLPIEKLSDADQAFLSELN